MASVRIACVVAFCACLCFPNHGGAHSVAPVLPDLSDSSRGVLGNRDEERIATQAVAALHDAGRIYSDPEVTAYVQALGQRLRQRNPEIKSSFEFFVVDDRSINAFALPAGYIGLHTGLIFATQTESELASVLAHEMAHVSQQHIARLYERQGLDQLLALGGVLAAIVAGVGRERVDVAAAAANVGSGLAIQNQLGFSRDFEREADRVGLEILSQAGFDPQGMPDFFGRLQQHARFNDNNAYAFLRTHPVTSERLAESQNRLRHLPVRMVANSLEFTLVREKIRVHQLGAAAVRYYRDALAQQRFAHEGATWFGLALAHWALHQSDEAWVSAQRAEASGLSHAFLSALQGRIMLARQDYAAAVRIFRDGRRRWPYARALLYGEIDARLQSGALKAALDVLREGLQGFPNDAELWLLQARAYADRDALRYHYALGRAHEGHGRWALALEHYQLAQAAHGDDFYLRSTLESRIRELERRLSEREPASER